MATNKKLLISERDGLKAKIAKGKLKGRALKKAIGRVYYLNGRLKSTKSVAKKKSRHMSDKRQLILPGFLAQLDVVHIEELVKERLLRKIDEVVDQKVSDLFKVG